MRAMPTFQIYKQRQKVEEIVGADVGKLEGLLGQYNAASSPFTGQGRKLSGANPPWSPLKEASGGSSSGSSPSKVSLLRHCWLSCLLWRLLLQISRQRLHHCLLYQTAMARWRQWTKVHPQQHCRSGWPMARALQVTRAAHIHWLPL